MYEKLDFHLNLHVVRTELEFRGYSNLNSFRNRIPSVGGILVLIVRMMNDRFRKIVWVLVHLKVLIHTWLQPGDLAASLTSLAVSTAPDLNRWERLSN